jgi:hypothetical protein
MVLQLKPGQGKNQHCPSRLFSSCLSAAWLPPLLKFATYSNNHSMNVFWLSMFGWLERSGVIVVMDGVAVDLRAYNFCCLFIYSGCS